MVLLDCHNHTEHSYDGETPLSVMCDAANQNGFSVYCITEHYDCDLAEEMSLMQSVEGCYADIDAYCAAHSGAQFPTKILKGIELGQPLQNPQAAKAVMDKLGAQMDFVIGSLHNVAGEQDFYLIDYPALGEAGLAALCRRYYAELLEMSKAGGFNSMGHITYPYRYAVMRGVPLNLAQYDEMVAETMRNLIQKGIALEINVSGYRQGVGEPLPGKHHLKLYKDLGGELLTIGSDAHRISDFGKNIADGLELIQEMGFAYITYFEKRKPVMIKL